MRDLLELALRTQAAVAENGAAPYSEAGAFAQLRALVVANGGRVFRTSRRRRGGPGVPAAAAAVKGPGGTAAATDGKLGTRSCSTGGDSRGPNAPPHGAKRPGSSPDPKRQDAQPVIEQIAQLMREAGRQKRREQGPRMSWLLSRPARAAADDDGSGQPSSSSGSGSDPGGDRRLDRQERVDLLERQKERTRNALALLMPHMNRLIAEEDALHAKEQEDRRWPAGAGSSGLASVDARGDKLWADDKDIARAAKLLGQAVIASVVAPQMSLPAWASPCLGLFLARLVVRLMVRVAPPPPAPPGAVACCCLPACSRHELAAWPNCSCLGLPTASDADMLTTCVHPCPSPFPFLLCSCLLQPPSRPARGACTCDAVAGRAQTAVADVLLAHLQVTAPWALHHIHANVRAWAYT